MQKQVKQMSLVPILRILRVHTLFQAAVVYASVGYCRYHPAPPVVQDVDGEPSQGHGVPRLDPINSYPLCLILLCLLLRY